MFRPDPFMFPLYVPPAIIAQLPSDYTVRAELTGPAYPTPKTLVTRPGTPFDIPTLALLGKHTLSNIRLVDGNGTTLFGAMPQAVIIETINDPLITEVKTRPLTTAELQERGEGSKGASLTNGEHHGDVVILSIITL